MRHRIELVDPFHGGETRTVVWDDVEGTVEGDHYDVPWLRWVLDQPAPVTLGDEAISIELADAGHSAPDFLALLHKRLVEAGAPPLPPELARVRATPWQVLQVRPGTVA